MSIATFDDLAQSGWLRPLGYLAIAGLLYILHLDRQRRASKLITNSLTKARQALENNNFREAIELFKKALSNATQLPESEREIIAEIATGYRANGVAFDFTNYTALMRQLEVLGTKNTHVAMPEIKDVLGLKRDLIATMPSRTPTTTS